MPSVRPLMLRKWLYVVAPCTHAWRHVRHGLSKVINWRQQQVVLPSLPCGNILVYDYTNWLDSSVSMAFQRCWSVVMALQAASHACAMGSKCSGVETWNIPCKSQAMGNVAEQWARQSWAARECSVLRCVRKTCCGLQMAWPIGVELQVILISEWAVSDGWTMLARLGDSIGMGQGLALRIMLHGQGYMLDKLFGLPDCWARLVVGWSMCNKLCTCVPQVAATWGGSYQSVHAVGLLAASRDDTNTVIRLCLGRGLPKFKYYY